MRIAAQTFALPKEGRSFDDYEDAYFPEGAQDLSCHSESHEKIESFRAAVCDGATDSCFSQYWARLLARGYVENGWQSEFGKNSIESQQALWKDELNSKELPWYAEEKAEQGAFAAVIGLSLFESGNGWKALGIGDSCIFQTRNGELLKAFPISNPAEFDNFPVLVGSLPEKNAGVFNEEKIFSTGTWAAGDVFFLMTDALACWFLNELKESNQIIDWLSRVETHEEFADVVSKERKSVNSAGHSRMKDDDATFTRIIVDGKPAGVSTDATKNAGNTLISAKKAEAKSIAGERSGGARQSDAEATQSSSVSAVSPVVSSSAAAPARPSSANAGTANLKVAAEQAAIENDEFIRAQRSAELARAADASRLSKKIRATESDRTPSPMRFIVIGVCIVFVVALFLGKSKMAEHSLNAADPRVRTEEPNKRVTDDRASAKSKTVPPKSKNGKTTAKSDARHVPSVDTSALDPPRAPHSVPSRNSGGAAKFPAFNPEDKSESVQLMPQRKEETPGLEKLNSDR